MASPSSPHHLWSERPRAEPPDGNLSVTEGQDRFSSARSRCCLLRADQCAISLRGVQDGERSRSLLLEMTGRREIPQICRRPGKPDCKPLTSAAPRLNHYYRKLSVCEAEPKRSECLRLHVNKCQSQQARLQGHMMEGGLLQAPASAFLLQKSTFKL
ncbi:unnamed protein product [Pleuronectes platessa]|uniref:Uncharacterized protein n=1 Tax=Pleuronectes platessa TaxID=8262 RepID=A0A9N7VTP4_PLEPL|nr:unnamed protein product [Pleuronectes platessa]